jgi:hypothetical protein
MTKKEEHIRRQNRGRVRSLLVRIQSSERLSRLSQNILITLSVSVMVIVAVAIIIMKRQHVDYKVAEEAAYSKITDHSTYEELQAYVVNFKGGKHYEEIAKRFKRMTYIKEEWELAESRNNAEAYAIFLEHYPYSFMSEEAHTRLDSLRYKELMQDPTPLKLEAFVEKYPDNKHIEEVKRILYSAKQEAVRKKTGDYLCSNFYRSAYRPSISLREVENNVYEGLAPCRGDTLIRFRIEFTKRLKVSSFKLMGKVAPKAPTSDAEE